MPVLAQRLWPGKTAKNRLLDVTARRELRKLRDAGLLNLRCTPELAATLNSRGYKSCETFAIHEYPIRGHYHRKG